MTDDLRGKTALVTGGAKRVGRAICLRLAAEGVHIAFNFLTSAAEAAATAKGVEALGVKVAAVRADVSDLGDCDRLAEEAGRLTGRIDILVNNASAFPRTPLAGLAGDLRAFDDEFRRIAAIHMEAPLYLGTKLGLAMKANGWGRIVHLLDRVVARGQAYSDWALYLVTKYGLHGINQVLAQELAPEVTVNGIAPGMVVAPEGFTAEQVEKIVRKIPLRHVVGVEEIAEDVLYLVRSRSKTGSVLLTDGGSGLRTF